MSSSGRSRFVVLVAGVLAAGASMAQPAPVSSQEPESQPTGPEIFRERGARVATAIPQPAVSGFWDRPVIGGLDLPTSVEFSADGRIFIAEKSGRIKVFDGLGDSTPSLFADLKDRVYNYWDRGLLGLALAPGFPADPYVYVLYSYNVPLGATSPDPGFEKGASDACPDPPGALRDGCRGSARLSRFAATGDLAGPEQVLINDWCQQFPIHSIGTVVFGPDGALYVGAGESAGASNDYGQYGGSVVNGVVSPTPRNPCGDPPVPVGGTQTPPGAEGGAMRAQDLRTTADPVTLDGGIIRVDPDTGAAAPGNPLTSSPDLNARRIVAFGLRNPYRFTFRPGAPSPELWIGDVGQSGWEEIDQLVDPAAQATPANFGWPCYEALNRDYSADSLDLTLCEDLYADVVATPGTVRWPYHYYAHSTKTHPGSSCPSGGAALSGIAFYEGGTYPDAYDGALFFADYSRRCITAMLPGANGLPDPAEAQTFVKDAAGPVDLTVGPNGDLFYLALGDHGLANGALRRLVYDPTAPPTARITATPSEGPAPLGVDLDGSASTDPEGGALDYAWDLDADTAFDDGTAAMVHHDYGHPGIHRVRLRVTDPAGARDTAETFITVGSSGRTVSYLSDIDWLSADNGYGPVERDMSVGESGSGDGQPLTLQGVAYEKGLGVHPYGGASGGPADVTYAIPECTRFDSDVGIDDETGTAGSVVFEVWLDDGTGFVRTYQSDVLTGSSAGQSPSVDLAGATRMRLRVTNAGDNNYSDHADWAGARVLCPGNAAPVALIEMPDASTTWSANETIDFEGSATDTEDGPLSAARLVWSLVLHHCGLDGACHAHSLDTFSGVAGGSFVAPDHAYPSHLELRLRATDSRGASDVQTLQLDPATTELRFESQPSGLQLSVGSGSGVTPFERTVVVGSQTTIVAPATQSSGAVTYDFYSWSDGGSRAHGVITDADGGSYTARYVQDAAIDTCAGATTDSPTATWMRDPISAGDADWYRFRHVGGYARVVLGRLSAGASLELYGSCGTLLARSDRGGTSFEEIYRSLPAGRYRVRISGGGQASAAAVRFSSLPEGLLVLSSARWISGGTLHIAGELLNNSARRLADPGIRATFFDASGTRIGQRSAGGFIDVLAPRRRTSFHLRVPVPAGYARASLTTFGSPTTAGTISGLSSAFTSITSAGGTRHYQGTIRNEGSSQVRDPAIFVTLYDGYGNVLNGAGARGSPTLLGPGESATFDLAFAERYESANRIARQVRAAR